MDLNTLLSALNHGTDKGSSTQPGPNTPARQQIDLGISRALSVAADVYHSASASNSPSLLAQSGVNAYIQLLNALAKSGLSEKSANALTHGLLGASATLKSAYVQALAKLPRELQSKDWRFSVSNGRLVFAKGQQDLTAHDLANLERVFAETHVESAANQVATFIASMRSARNSAAGPGPLGWGQIDADETNFGQDVNLRAYLTATAPSGKYNPGAANRVDAGFGNLGLADADTADTGWANRGAVTADPANHGWGNGGPVNVSPANGKAPNTPNAGWPNTGSLAGDPTDAGLVNADPATAGSAGAGWGNAGAANGSPAGAGWGAGWGNPGTNNGAPPNMGWANAGAPNGRAPIGSPANMGWGNAGVPNADPANTGWANAGLAGTSTSYANPAGSNPAAASQAAQNLANHPEITMSLGRLYLGDLVTTRPDFFREHASVAERSPVLIEGPRSADTCEILHGRCSCGAVCFSVEDAFEYAYYCHCSRCRARTGSAFSAVAGIAIDKLQVTVGATQLLIEGECSDGYGARCGRCFNFLFAAVRGRQFVHVSLGALAGTPSRIPNHHIYVASKAPWYSITDRLPQFQELP